MTQEEYDKAHALFQKLSDLKKLFLNTDRGSVCLSYVSEYTAFNVCKYHPIDNLYIIQDILDRHNHMIREEINEEIEKLKKEIEQL